MPEKISASLRDARRQTDLLFSLLTPRALYKRPVPERHRLIFYLGHLEAFDWNHIGVWANGESRFHAGFDRLFEAGIDPDANGLPSDKASEWPPQADVEAYKGQARERVDQLIGSTPEPIVRMALEHRLMHAETLAYLLHNLPHEDKTFLPRTSLPRTATASPPPAVTAPVEIPGGLATLGREPEDGFGWDNEFRTHLVRVPPFLVDRHKVTNAEYLEFVHQGAKAPHFWTMRNGEWRFRGMFDFIPLPADAPVYVTHLEAEEYAVWKNKKLLSEAQFHRAAYASRDGGEREYPWGNDAPAPGQGAFDFTGWDPVAVTATPECDSDLGVAQLTGNGWEWTSTVFEPFPGFDPSPNYPGYSQNFFDGHHYVLKGASCRTGRQLLRRSFRNWFRPDYPYVYATFRLAES